MTYAMHRFDRSSGTAVVPPHLLLSALRSAFSDDGRTTQATLRSQAHCTNLAFANLCHMSISITTRMWLQSPRMHLCTVFSRTFCGDVPDIALQDLAPCATSRYGSEVDLRLYRPVVPGAFGSGEGIDLQLLAG